MSAGNHRALVLCGLIGAGALLVLAARRSAAPAAATPAPSTTAPAATPAPAPALPVVRDLGASVLIPGGAYMVRIIVQDGTYSPAFGGAGGQYMGNLSGLNLTRANLRAVEAQAGGAWTPVWRA